MITANNSSFSWFVFDVEFMKASYSVWFDDHLSYANCERWTLRTLAFIHQVQRIAAILVLDCWIVWIWMRFEWFGYCICRYIVDERIQNIFRRRSSLYIFNMNQNHVFNHNLHSLASTLLEKWSASTAHIVMLKMLHVNRLGLCASIQSYCSTQKCVQVQVHNRIPVVLKGAIALELHHMQINWLFGHLWPTCFLLWTTVYSQEYETRYLYY